MPPPLLKTFEVLRRGIEQGEHPGAQIYVSRGGTVLADEAFGQARVDAAMTRDSLVPWLSAGKPAMAICIAKLWERGSVGLDDRVVKFIPEFGRHGKEAVTIRHILTHTGGFPHVGIGWPHANWDQAIQRICGALLHDGWRAGEVAAYHMQSGWFVLGEIVRRIDGRMPGVFMREDLFEPLGMLDSWLGMPPEKFRAYGQRIAIMHRTEMPPPAPPKPDPLFSEQRMAYPAPGGNASGPMRELGIFYEMLLAHGQRGATRIVSPQTVEALAARHRSGMFDHVFKHIIDWGLGFIVDSKQYGADTVPYGFGPHASRRTFGHSGNQSSCAFADPEHGLAVAWMCNGQPGVARHEARARAVNAAIYEDLGLS